MVWLMPQILKSDLLCSVRRRKGEGLGVQSLLKISRSLCLDKASGTPIPERIPELNPCIVVATMSVSVITETA